MPATREEVQSIRSAGASSVDVALVNTGLVEDENLLELVALEICELATTCGLSVGAIERS
jgi:translation elongation factor EF-Tu-like GTPase